MDKLIKAIKAKESSQWVVAGLFAGCVLFGVLYVLSAKAKVVNDSKPVANNDFASSTQHGDLKSYFTNQINKRIKNQDSIVKNVKNEVDKVSKEREKELVALKAQNDNLQKQMQELINKVNSKDKDNKAERKAGGLGKGSINNAAFDPNIIPSNYEPSNNYRSNTVQLASVGGSDEIEIISVNLTSNKPRFKNIATYLPAGTRIKGIILGGVDAPTEVYGNSQTRVVTIRFIGNGNISNGFKGGLKDCTLLASAWGNASSERVAMRGERLTCVGDSGNVLETDIIATIYGNDGRQDVRGRMVYPEGKLIQRAFLAGSLSGLGNGIANSLSSQSVSPLGVTSVIPNESIFKAGAAQGVSKGMDKLSDYYIKRAEQLQPIVQVGSGTEVEIVIQKGFYLDGKSHSESQSSNPETPFVNNSDDYSASSQAKRAIANIRETA